MKAAQEDAGTLQAHITRTYLNLRVGIGVIGAVLPLLLWIGARQGLLDSMSAYYYTPMRDAFVGALVSIGFFLYLYKGFSTQENWALNCAGALAIGVAMVPTAATDETAGTRSTLHAVFAVLFFLSIAYVSVFRASDTLSLVRDTRQAEKLRNLYRFLGIGMIASPLIAVALQSATRQRSRTFFIEAVGVWMFSAYWLVKSREIEVTDAECLALQGKLQAAPASDVGAVAPGRLIQTEPGEAAEMPLNGKICYVELPAGDVAVSSKFYTSVFGWRVRQRGDGSTAFDDAVGQVSGTWKLGRAPAAEPGMLMYIMVDSVEKTLERIVAQGGAIVQPIGGDAPAITARFRDPAGNLVGLYQPAPSASAASPGRRP